MTFLCLMAGGACGAIARYRVGACFLSSKRLFPMGTFLINIVGALILGMVSGLKLNGNLYALFGDGFCGAFTTFSTYMVESVLLSEEKLKKKAAFYMFLSIVVGILSFSISYFICRGIKIG